MLVIAACQPQENNEPVTGQIILDDDFSFLEEDTSADDDLVLDGTETQEEQSDDTSNEGDEHTHEEDDHEHTDDSSHSEDMQDNENNEEDTQETDVESTDDETNSEDTSDAEVSEEVTTEVTVIDPNGEDDQETEEVQEVIVEPISEENFDDQDVAYTIDVIEGELVALDLQAEDPDGDSLEYTFTNPLNAQGRWQTVIGDEGRYLVTVTASDGKLSTSEDVLIVVGRANRPPVIECPESFTVKETETVFIDCTIYDEEGDSVSTSYEGWSTSATKKTTYDDAGVYSVLIRSNDENQEATQKVEIIVENVNRPPAIQPIDAMTLMETNTVLINPQVSDPDGDDVTVSFSKPLDKDGVWMTDDGDAGTYEVIVTATDGRATVSEPVEITITQINTAPVLKPVDDITVEEGDTIKLPVNAYDPEGDELVVSYSGFMATQEYDTSYNDAGVYEQTITVSDGVLSSSQSLSITVIDKNRAPIFIIPGGGN